MCGEINNNCSYCEKECDNNLTKEQIEEERQSPSAKAEGLNCEV